MSWSTKWACTSAGHPNDIGYGTVCTATSITVGIHDGSINNCDNNEKWESGAAPPVDGSAAQAVMLNEAANPDGGQGWFQGLHSGTVRVSVPWDIALPDSSNSSLVTEYDPPGSQWAVGTEVHLIQRLAAQHPEQKIIVLSDCQCLCTTMYRINLTHLCWVLENLVEGKIVNQIKVDPETRRWAMVALERMLAIRNQPAPVR